MACLLLGCGNSRAKKIAFQNQPGWNEPLTTLDMDPNCGADVVFDLDARPLHLPFADESFDELAAFDVLEHVGKQGDWRGFFDEFAEYWRVLKPGGHFFILVPINGDMLADPGHTRFFHGQHFYFLSQDWYAERFAAGIATTDYRWFWKRDFAVVSNTEVALPGETTGHHVATILRKQ